MDEGRFRAGLTRGFEQVERADCVDVKIVKGNASSEIVGGLCGSVDDRGGANLKQEIAKALAVADVDFVVVEGG